MQNFSAKEKGLCRNDFKVAQMQNENVIHSIEYAFTIIFYMYISEKEIKEMLRNTCTRAQIRHSCFVPMYSNCICIFI